MPYVKLSFRDGEWSVRLLSPDEADGLAQQGHDFAHIREEILDAWQAHLKQHAVFDALWRALDEEISYKHETLRADPLSRLGNPEMLMALVEAKLLSKNDRERALMSLCELFTHGYSGYLMGAGRIKLAPSLRERLMFLKSDKDIGKAICNVLKAFD